MGKLILVRHGETNHNKDKVYYGWTDVRLNETGKIQVEKAKKIIFNINYDKIYTSPLLRARETAEIINIKKIELIEKDDLKELNFGIFEGFTYDEILKKYPKEAKIAFSDWENYTYETGESPKQLQERVIKLIEKDIDLKDEITVLVTHWGVISCILSYYFSNKLEGYWKYNSKNGGISIISFGDNNFPTLEGFNIGENNG
ncbi:MAG: histidine phosphatase family protein [Fusobacteriaceae bacterium]